MDSFDEAFSLIKKYCRENVKNDTIYKLWLEPMKLREFNDNELVIELSEFKQGIVKNKFGYLLHEAIENVLGFDIKIKFVNEDNSETPDIDSLEKKEHKSNNNSELTFENYVEGSSNHLAYAAAKAVSSSPGFAYNPLFIYGHSGLGKTHLLKAIANEIRASNPDVKIIYISAEKFTNELVHALAIKKMKEFHDKYRTIDVLLVDDIQFIGGKIQTEEEFFNTFNTLTEENKQVVLASDRPPKEINILNERMKSRFESGLLADIQPPDLETRMAIIKKKADLLNLDLNDEVVRFVAEKIKQNIRQLEGAVKKINAYYIIDDHKPSILVAQKAIKDIQSDNQPIPVTIEKILQEVARTYGVTVENIKSDKKNAEITQARRAAMYIIREITSLPVKKIGEELGNKHHTTVLYNIKKTEEEMENNISEKNKIQNIINNINDNISY
ncbi:MAG: chromosomal replication initiator protein DnaA [Clostridia bacterium]|nr:chromosomal replication initiator protein DnaA [Clostridia bacterium]